MKPSVETMGHIYSAWCQALPPLQVAKALRLVPMTVLKEYVRLDDEARMERYARENKEYIERLEREIKASRKALNQRIKQAQADAALRVIDTLRVH